VRDTFSATINDLDGGPSDSPRPEDAYVHPLAALNPNLVFDPVPMGNRGTWEQIVEAGPVVLGEFIFPLGQSGFIDSGANPDPHFDSLHSIWAEWRFVPMLHIAEDLATDPDGDVDDDGVLDGFERWYFGSNSPQPTDDADEDGASLLDEFLNGLDPTEADTDGDGMADGFEVASACLSPQARDSTADPDADGLDNLTEYTGATDPCTPEPAAPPPATPAPPEPPAPVAPPPTGSGGLVADEGSGMATWWYALISGAILLVISGLAALGKARGRRWTVNR